MIFFFSLSSLQNKTILFNPKFSKNAHVLCANLKTKITFLQGRFQQLYILFIEGTFLPFSSLLLSTHDKAWQNIQSVLKCSAYWHRNSPSNGLILFTKLPSKSKEKNESKWTARLKFIPMIQYNSSNGIKHNYIYATLYNMGILNWNPFRVKTK